MTIAAVLFMAAAALPATAATPAPADQPRPWTEAIVSVRDLDQSSRLLREVGGWRVTGRGTIDRAELTYWKLPGRAKGRFLRICAPEAAAGCIRFVRFTGMPQRPIRLAARPWDTGGIFSLMIRSSDVRSVFDRAIAMGWWAETDVYAFTFGASDLKNVVITGPDGFNLALYERVSPPFTDYRVGLLSQAFNSMRMVRDQRVSVAYYQDVLGFSTAFNEDYRDRQPTTGNFSIPINYAEKIVRRAAAMHPTPGPTGRVELMQFVGFEGRDLSSHAGPPNLGIISVRYPVADLAAYRGKVTRSGGTIAFEGNARIAGVGKTDIFAVRDPDGNLTEFYQSTQTTDRY